jgi:hypothetical protein
MTTRDLINKLYGTNTFDKDDPMGVTSIAQSPTQFLDNDPQRIQLTIINTGTNDMMIWTDASVSPTKGIRIAGSGGSYEIDFTRFGTYPTRTYWAYGIGGTTTISSKCLIATSQ